VENFADCVIAKAEKSGTVHKRGFARLNSPITAVCAAAVIMIGAGAFLLNGGGKAPDDGVTTDTSALQSQTSQLSQTAQTVQIAVNPDRKELVYEFGGNTPVSFMSSEFGEYKPKKLTLTSTGLVIDYYYNRNATDKEIVLSNLFHENKDFDQIEIQTDKMRYTINNDLARFQGQSDWDFDDWKALRYTSSHVTLLGSGEGHTIERDTLDFVEEIDLNAITFITLGGAFIDLNFDYALDTRKPVKPDSLNALESQLYDKLQELNRPVSWLLGDLPPLPTEFDAWMVCNIKDVEEIHYRYYSKNGEILFIPEEYGRKLDNNFIEPPWSGGSNGNAVIFPDDCIKNNPDGSITVSVVVGIAPSEGNNTIRTAGRAVGYTCPLDGGLYYFPQVVADLPVIDYTFIKEDGTWKISRIDGIDRQDWGNAGDVTGVEDEPVYTDVPVMTGIPVYTDVPVTTQRIETTTATQAVTVPYSPVYNKVVTAEDGGFIFAFEKSDPNTLLLLFPGEGVGSEVNDYVYVNQDRISAYELEEFKITTSGDIELAGNTFCGEHGLIERVNSGLTSPNGFCCGQVFMKEYKGGTTFAILLVNGLGELHITGKLIISRGGLSIDKREEPIDIDIKISNIFTD
jgi:hypothetical protein